MQLKCDKCAIKLQIICYIIRLMYFINYFNFEES